jgi:hypothetical protein
MAGRAATRSRVSSTAARSIAVSSGVAASALPDVVAGLLMLLSIAFMLSS